MGKEDVATRRYMQDSRRFADAFNYALYGGEQIIRAADLKPLNTVSVPPGQGEHPREERRRDTFRCWQSMTDDRVAYALLGIEDQTRTDRSMPARCMLYDALGYADQIDELKRKNREGHLLKSSAEFLSGLREEDRVLPVVTLVLHFGTEPWDGETRLHDLLRVEDEDLLPFVADYRMNLVSPASVEDADISKFRTDLGLVLGYIKHANDKEALRKVMKSDKRYESMDAESVGLINLLTNSHIKVDEGEGKAVDTCKAIRDIRQEGYDEGHEEGDKESLITLGDLVSEGVLSVEDASRRARLTPEEFEEKVAAIQKR